MNKKGAEMTVGTIIVIVLALVVLVVLVVGFTGGWGNLWSRISSFFGGGPNVDAIVQACQVACTTQSQYAWCTMNRTLVLDDQGTKVNSNCLDFSKKSIGLAPCPSISCPNA